MAVPHFVDYHNFVKSFETRKCWSSKLILLFTDYFGYFRSLEFSHEFQGQLVSYCKEANCDSHEQYIESADKIEEYCSLNNIKFFNQLM